MTRGQNIIKEGKQKTRLEAFFEQLNDPLIFILFIAVSISLLLKEFSDAIIILTVILVNAIIGVIQEGKAQKALESLKKLTTPKALLREKGHIREIPASDLIPGDEVVLDAGRQIPADLELIEVNSLKVEEAALTGESVPVEKDLKSNNRAFMSTNVTYGRGVGKVTAIGMDTEIGKIAKLINEAPTETTPLQKRLADLGKILSTTSVVLCLLLFCIAVAQKRDIMEMLITAISLAVAAVPEGLPAIVTMVLALSVSRMVKVNTIVKRLPSVETLGCVSVVCTDKTGTLTQNKMTVVSCYCDGQTTTPEKLNPRVHKHFLEGFTLCNDASIDRERIGDPTELALLDMTFPHGLTRQILEKQKPRIAEIAFDSDRKMMTTMHREDSAFVSYTKGSLEELLKHCTRILHHGQTIPFTLQHKKDILQSAEEMSAKALRLLALGMRIPKDSISSQKPQESDLTFVGLVGMIDPLRPEVFHAAKEFVEAGVRTIMITGDRKDTAYAIANELGIASSPSECITGQDIDTMNDTEFSAALKNIRVFSQVSPEHKVRIVKGFKNNGKIVAMTGDGVNDAPSLKSADVGIAMGMAGTDVAKNAADLILTDDNFATIAKAIAQGRCIYANIKKSVLFLLSSNFGEIITMLGAILLGLISPLKPSHILWINLITDSLPALALGVDEGNPDKFMKKPPRDKNENLFAHGGLACTLFYGILIAFISMTAFLLLPVTLLQAKELEITLENIRQILEIPAVTARAQTYAFTVLGISQIFHAIGMRDTGTSLLRMKHFSNKLMLAALCIGFFLQFLVTEVPYFINAFGTCNLSFVEWRQLIVLSLTPLLAHELLLLAPWNRSKQHRH